MMQVDPKWLINSVTIKKALDTDEWGNAIYAEPMKIERVRVDLTPTYSGSDNERSLVANGVVFLYSEFSTPFQEITQGYLNSVLLIDKFTQEYLIKQISPLFNVEDGSLFGYELEVL
mgnify:CR=1 FL=1